MIERRTNKNSSNKKLFDLSKHVYNEALKRSGHNKDIKYIDRNNITSKKGKNRKRKVLWFNPLYDKAIKTNTGRNFINIINKHFGESKIKKFITKNNVKISYSCMINIQNITNVITLRSSKPIKIKIVQKSATAEKKHECPL